MILMALDHTRDFLTDYPGNPLDPAQTSLAMFMTRWVTHLCAPAFVFLAGTSIFLQSRKRSNAELGKQLVTRGLWLIIAELTLVHIAFNFNWRWDTQLLQVIWAIGVAMVLMAVLIHVGVRGNLLFGAVLVAVHNLFDPITRQDFGSFAWLWQLLHVPGFPTGPPTNPPIVLVAYPLVPWIGVMPLGYAFGSLLSRPPAWRRAFLIRVGFSSLALFVVLRWFDRYGDPLRWTAQDVWWRSFMSFLNVQKYPPSLLFLLATLGIAALIMALIEAAEERGLSPRILQAIAVYGRVPFFYFLLHLAVIHALAIALTAAAGADWRWWFRHFPAGGVLTGRPPGFGVPLPGVWLLWIGVVSLCFPPCKWYGNLRTRRGSRLLSYF